MKRISSFTRVMALTLVFSILLSLSGAIGLTFAHAVEHSEEPAKQDVYLQLVDTDGNRIQSSVTVTLSEGEEIHIEDVVESTLEGSNSEQTYTYAYSYARSVDGSELSSIALRDGVLVGSNDHATWSELGSTQVWVVYEQMSGETVSAMTDTNVSVADSFTSSLPAYAEIGFYTRAYGAYATVTPTYYISCYQGDLELAVFPVTVTYESTSYHTVVNTFELPNTVDVSQQVSFKIWFPLETFGTTAKASSYYYTVFGTFELNTVGDAYNFVPDSIKWEYTILDNGGSTNLGTDVWYSGIKFDNTVYVANNLTFSCPVYLDFPVVVPDLTGESFSFLVEATGSVYCGSLEPVIVNIAASEFTQSGSILSATLSCSIPGYWGFSVRKDTVSVSLIDSDSSKYSHDTTIFTFKGDSEDKGEYGVSGYKFVPYSTQPTAKFDLGNADVTKYAYDTVSQRWQNISSNSEGVRYEAPGSMQFRIVGTLPPNLDALEQLSYTLHDSYSTDSAAPVSYSLDTASFKVAIDGIEVDDYGFTDTCTDGCSFELSFDDIKAAALNSGVELTADSVIEVTYDVSRETKYYSAIGDKPTAIGRGRIVNKVWLDYGGDTTEASTAAISPIDLLVNLEFIDRGIYSDVSFKLQKLVGSNYVDFLDAVKIDEGLFVFHGLARGVTYRLVELNTPIQFRATDVAFRVHWSSSSGYYVQKQTGTAFASSSSYYNQQSIRVINDYYEVSVTKEGLVTDYSTGDVSWDTWIPINYGDTVTFRLTGIVPVDIGDHTECAYVIHDAFRPDDNDEIFVLDPSTVKIIIDGSLVDASEYTVVDSPSSCAVYDSCSFEIVFSDLKATLSSLGVDDPIGKQVVVYYDAMYDVTTTEVETADVEVYSSGFPSFGGNRAIISYTYEGEDPVVSEEGYSTFGNTIIEIWKQDDEGNNLYGAEFQIERWNGFEWEYHSTSKSVKSNLNAVYRFEGIAEGRYRMIESITPDGFLTMTPFEFEVSVSATACDLVDWVAPDGVWFWQTGSQSVIYFVIDNYKGLDIEKEVLEVNDMTVEESWGKWASHDAGDTVKFRITANVPHAYEDFDSYKYLFFDTAHASNWKQYESFIIDETSFTITLDGTDVPLEEYTFEMINNGTGFQLVFPDIKSTLANMDVDATGSKDLVIEYEAVYCGDSSSSTATYDSGDYQGMRNHVELLGFPNGSEEPDTELSDNVYVGSAELRLYKVDKKGTSLSGETFVLEKLIGENWTEVPAVASDYTSWNYQGLDAGKYRLTETVNPEGYRSIESFEFTVSVEYDAAEYCQVSITEFENTWWEYPVYQYTVDNVNGVIGVYVENIEDIPYVDKDVYGTTLRGEQAWSSLVTAAFGDTLDFRVEATIPECADGCEWLSYTFTDLMDSVFTFIPDSLSITLNGTAVPSDEYTISLHTYPYSSQFVVVFEDIMHTAENIGLNNIADGSLVLTYQCEFGYSSGVDAASTPLGGVSHFEGYTNNVELSWASDTSEGSSETGVCVANGWFAVNKVDHKDIPLSGSEFILEKLVDGEWTYYQTAVEENCTHTFEGLATGEYRLVEKKAPPGYQVLDPIEFTFTVAFNDIIGFFYADAIATNDEFAASDEGGVTVTVANEPTLLTKSVLEDQYDSKSKVEELMFPEDPEACFVVETFIPAKMFEEGTVSYTLYDSFTGPGSYQLNEGNLVGSVALAVDDSFIYLTQDTDYFVTLADTSFEITIPSLSDFVELNSVSTAYGLTVRFRYWLDISETGSIVNTAYGHCSNGVLEYMTDPDAAKVYYASLPVYLDKVDSDGNKLAGAYFTVQEWRPEYQCYTQSFWYSSDGVTERLITSLPGKYIIREYIAPDGYSFAPVISFSIVASIDENGDVAISVENLEGATLDIRDDAAYLTVTNYAEDPQVTVQKTVMDSSGAWVDSLTYEATTPLVYKVDGTLPSDLTSPCKYIFHDTVANLFDGTDSYLALDESTVTVKIGEQTIAPLFYTVEQYCSDGCIFEVIFDDITIPIAHYGLTVDANTVVSVRYTAKLDVLAATTYSDLPSTLDSARSANLENWAWVEWNTGVTDRDSADIITGFLNVYKQDVYGIALSGADFKLQRWDGTAYVDFLDSIFVKGTDKNNPDRWVFAGLAEGVKYKLVETVVPDGYQKMADVEFLCSPESVYYFFGARIISGEVVSASGSESENIYITVANKSSPPYVLKEVQELNDSTGESSYGDFATADFGDGIAFRISTKVPRDIGVYSACEFTIHDCVTVAKGESLVLGHTDYGLLSVYIGGEWIDPTLYTIDKSPDSCDKSSGGSVCSFEIIFSDLNSILSNLGITDFSDVEILLTYYMEYGAAEATTSGGVEYAGSHNKAAVTYSFDGGEPNTVESNEVTVTSVTLRVLKRGMDDITDYDPYAEVEFQLEKWTGSEWEYQQTSVKDIDGGNTFVHYFNNIDAGLYRLVEAAAPDGFLLLDPIEFEVAVVTNGDYLEAELVGWENIEGEAVYTQMDGYPNVYLDVYNRPEPTVAKFILKDAFMITPEPTWDKYTSFSVNDVLYYKLVGTLPYNILDYDTYAYIFHDKLYSNADTIDMDRVQELIVKIGETTVPSDKYQVGYTCSDCTFTVKFEDIISVAHELGVTLSDDIEVVVTYNLVPYSSNYSLSRSDVNYYGIYNSAHLEYNGDKSPSDYTSAEGSWIAIFGKRGNDGATGLTGYEFILYRWNGEEYVELGTVPGIGLLFGDGNYKFVEVKAPEGYISGGEYEFVVKGSSFTSLSDDIYTYTWQSGARYFYIYNDPIQYELPSAGGLGTAPFLLAGSTLIFVPPLVAYRKKRKHI